MNPDPLMVLAMQQAARVLYPAPPRVTEPTGREDGDGAA